MGAIGRQELGYFEVSCHNLLVKVGSFRVFKRQEATDHGVEDDSAGPDIRLEAHVSLPGDHLWGRVAGRPTGCLK